MSFNPIEYLTKIKGKEYLEVKYRIQWFRDENPVTEFEKSLRLKTTIVEDDGEQGLVCAELYDPKGELLATAHKREHKKEFHDYLEKAETGAIGRVLAIAGYGTQFAEELELPEGKVVDAPVTARTTDKPSNSNENDLADEKEKRKQEDTERAKKQVKNNSKEESEKPENNISPSDNAITTGQKKAIENILTLLSKKKPDINIKTIEVEWYRKIGKTSLNELTADEAREFITEINRLMRA